MMNSEFKSKDYDPEAVGRKQGLDVQQIRADFPMLQHVVKGKPLIYFDSAATNHKPDVVINTMVEWYTSRYAQPQEEHPLSKQMTGALEEVRQKTAKLINARSDEVVFTSGCTESNNIVALGAARRLLQQDDEILLFTLEHHSGIVPWQIACELSGAKIVLAPVTADGEIELEELEKHLSPRTRIISFSHTSHALGTIQPVKEICRMAHKRNILVLVDAAQSAPHMKINVKDMDCDFLTFSAHKMGGPSGVGVLYGKAALLEQLPAHFGGHENMETVSFDGSEYKKPPKKFEAGTPALEAIVAFGSMVDYIEKLGIDKTEEYERALLKYATAGLSSIEKIRIYGNAPEKEPVLSFLVEGADVKELEKYLAEEHNIFIKAGDLSAQPLMKKFGIDGLARASFCYYNTKDEIDYFLKAVELFVSEKT